MPQINYKSDDTVKDAFLHSCLGKLVILAGFVVILLLIAYFTAPSEKEMTTNMEDNVMQCLQENDSMSTISVSYSPRPTPPRSSPT